MDDIIFIEQFNGVYIRVYSHDAGIEQELSEYFTFMVPGARFTPAYKNKIWDGKLRLYSTSRKTIYAGLLKHVIEFAEYNKYKIEFKNIDKAWLTTDVTEDEIRQFVDGLQLSARGRLLEVRDYQYQAIYHMIHRNRALMLSPTSCLSGDTIIEAEVNGVIKQYQFQDLYYLYDTITNRPQQPFELHPLKISIRLNTPHGLKDVIGVYRKFGPGLKITFHDQTAMKGSRYHLVLYNDEFIPIESLEVGMNLTDGQGSSKTITSIEDIGDDYWYDFSLDYEHECYIQNGIIHHNSGKSSLIYSVVRWHLQYNRKIIIIVPTTNLVEQLYSDFEDYSSFNGFPVNDYCQKLYSGQSKEWNRNVLITTYQSIMRWTPNEFRNHNVDVAIIDEAHLAKAKMITKIMESLPNAKYRIGLTGTLDGTLTNSLVIEGLTGPVHKVISTRELMDDGHVTELKIKCILLQYSNETKKAASRLKYQDEMNYLVTHPKRNQIITSMALSCSGNTLILFQYVEKHGKVLYEMIKEKANKMNRNVYFIYGNTSAVDREEIRKKIESEVDSIIIGSYQTVSTGINIPSLENIIFASPSKSRVRNLQSIGRGLRLKEGKNQCILFDIADDLSWKKRINYTLTHYIERVKIYTDEKFKFKIHKILLED